MQNDQDLLAKNTELEHSFRILMQQKAELQALLEAVPFAVFITGFDYSFQFCNQNTFSLLGYEPVLSDKDFIDNQIFGNHIEEWKIQYVNVLANNVSNFEMTLVNKDNHLIDVSVHSHKAIYESKSCSVNYLRDISIQKAIERDLKNEQKKTNLIIDSIPAMVFIKDKENRFCRVNKAFEEQTGLKNENIIHKSGFDLAKEKVLGSDDWADDNEVIETGIAKRNIIEPLLTDKHRWFLTDKIPYKNIDGEVIGIIGFSTDISERMHAEEELLRSEKMFRLLFETAPDGIILSSLDGKILSTNKAIENLLGYSSDEIRNLTNSDITPRNWQNTELETVNDALQNSENVRSFEKEYLRKDKIAIPALVTIWIIYNEDGTPIQLGTYVKDLSIEKKAAELEKSLFQKEKEQLEKDLDSKNRELNLKITKLIEVNALVRGVISDLELILKKDPKEKNMEIKLVINELMNHTNDDLWKQMELTFGQIHQSFYVKIYKLFPNLTRNEKRLCAFLKMNLSTKDISSITHQTIRSIEVARARLRIKMKLKRSDSLTKFFSQI